MPHQHDLKRLIIEKQRYLQKLKEKEARLGINTPVEILTEIEDLKANLNDLQTKLKATTDGVKPHSPNSVTFNHTSGKRQSMPFIHSGPVPPSLFIGRTHEIDQILGQVANPARGCSAISGDPRIGKTSLLHYLLRRPHIREDWGLSSNLYHFLYLDCQTIVPFSKAAFWHHTLRQLKQHLNDDEILGERVQNLLGQPNPDIYDLSGFFDGIAQAGRLVILMLDEFESILENVDQDSPVLLYHLRTLLNRPERGLVLVVVTRKPLKQLCAEFNFAGSPFDNSFTPLTLPPFSKAEVNELFIQYQADLSSDERERLRQLAGSHPYLIQLAASFIIRTRNSQDPLAQFEMVFERDTEGYFSEILEYSGPQEKMLLTWLALGQLSQHLPASHTGLGKLTNLFDHYPQEMGRLVKQGLVLDRPGGPALFSPIFSRWVLRKVLIAGGQEMLSRWAPAYENILSSIQQETFKSLVDKIIRRPAIIKKPELLAQVFEQQVIDSPLDSVGNRVLERYVIEKQIGGGGMADVFQARHLDLDRVVAIKRLRPILSTTEKFRSRFRREAQVVAGLRHPHIVQIYDFGIEDNRYYMVMEFIEGHDLRKYLYDLQAIAQALSWEQALRIATCVADALDYAHQREMIHRDVKPANILLTNDDGVFLADFGLVRLLGQADLTEAGGILGTPAYMAPEQLISQGQDIDHRVDIYALGGVVYEMITGRPPFEEADFPLGFINADPPSPGSCVPNLPEAASQIILKALAKDPAKRPASASQFVEELRQALRLCS